MRRTACGACLTVLLLSACSKPQKLTARPLPPPLLHTRHARTPRIDPAPRPEPLRPPPRPRVVPPPEQPVTLNVRELMPAGGVTGGKWRCIVIHHSASPKDTPDSMHRYHLKRGWSRGLGYHFVIGNGVNYPDGAVYAGPRWKKQQSGAHCASAAGRYFGSWRQKNYFNAHGIGICLVGNFEDGAPTSRQLRTLEALAGLLCDRLDINPAHVYGHGDVTHKTACPGAYLRRAIPQVRAEIARALAIKLSPDPPPGWPSGRDDAFTAAADVDPHGTVLVADLIAK